jgi:hypothetical protein
MAGGTGHGVFDTLQGFAGVASKSQGRQGNPHRFFSART